MRRLPKTTKPEVIEKLDREWKPKGSAKGYARDVRKTFIIRRSLLQKLEAWAFWKSGEEPNNVSVNKALNRILKDFFAKNSVDLIPLGELYEKLGKFRRKYPTE